jgi:His-Xaa-Ser system protein HxsD
MKGIFTKIEDGKILISLRKEFYEKSAVFSAAHKLTDRFVVWIQPVDNYTVGIYIQPKKDTPMSEDDIKETIFNFCNDIIDQQVRLDLEVRYGNIREMIVKQAFSPMTTADLTKELRERGINVTKPP